MFAIAGVLLSVSVEAAAPTKAPIRNRIAATPMRSSVRMSDGRELSYLRWAAPGKPVMLMLHGKGGYAASFTDLANHLANRFDLYAIDMRGRGYSTWARDGDYTVESTTADVANLVRSMGWSRIAVYGHSYGAVIAISFSAANADKVSLLVLEDGGPVDLPDGSAPTVLNPGQAAVAGTPVGPARKLRFANWAGAQDWQTRTCKYQCGPLLLDEQFVRTPDGVIERSDQVGISASARGKAFDHQWPAVKALAMPTLLLRAERGLVPHQIAEAMTRTNAQVSFVTIAGGEHSLRASRPQQSFAALDTFLASHPLR